MVTVNTDYPFVTGPASAVDGDGASFNGTTGRIIKDAGTPASGNVQGPASAVNGDLATFSGITGKIIADSGILASNVVQGPASATDGNLAVFNGTSGKLLKDGGAPASGGFIQFSQVNLTGGNFSTNNTSATDVTGATVTITTGAHRVFINLVIAGKSASANEYVKIFLNIDGSIVPSSTAYLTWVHGTDSSCNLSWFTDVLTAASHTFKIQIAGTNGAVLSTVYLQAANPLILQVAETSLTT